MADQPKTDKSTAELTVAQAAKRVGIPPAEVFSFRDYGTHVVVVTVEGRKLDSRGGEA
jgi:prolyl-tRNA editing enzyme YbaK/EbsC (Cys-tRNA(Pro) deacylase)